MSPLLSKLKQTALRFSHLANISATDRPLLDQNVLNAIFKKPSHAYTSGRYSKLIFDRNTGEHRSAYPGAGIDYEESRDYINGDDRRFMNWRQTARTGKHTIKLFSEEHLPNQYIVLDKRASMFFGTRSQLKITQALIVMAHLAKEAVNLNINNASMLIEKSILKSKVTSGLNGALQLVKLASKNVDLNNTNHLTLDYILKILLNSYHPGSSVSIVSDFYDLDEKHISLLRELNSRYHLSIIDITDPAEHNLPLYSPVQYCCNSNLENTITIDTKLQQQILQQQIDNMNNAKQLIFKKSGIIPLPVSTTDPVDKIEQILVQ